ncbi:MAG TPA: DEAD/DEAH box helicase, partial [Pseudolysinimonas sp.]|nr:DEAD/DEAH box helicase [Pseudolysinimonas sp.]
TFDRDSRPARTERDDRPARSWDRDARPARDDRSDRPARSWDRGDRDARPATRSWDRDARPRTDRDDRAPRSFGSDRNDRDANRTPHTPTDDVVLERLEAQAVTATEVDGIGFGTLGLGDNIVRALADLGAASPFPIQAATIPDVLAGRDVLGRGRTGSGKTIAFGAPLVERLLQMQKDSPSTRREFGRAPRALILAPTRELALQIDRTVQPIARSVGLFTTQIYGGVPYARQLGALERGVDIIVGTPGRVQDLINKGKLDLSKVVISVLDEADHMCELGFLEPVQEILDATSQGGQKLLFSATLDRGVADIVAQYLVEPAVYEVAGEDQASSTIDHRVLLMDQRDKQQVLIELASGPGKKLVFARTRAFAEMLADVLDEAGIRSESIHGDLNQSRRTRALEKLTSGRVDVLVATDVAARGIHVDDITLVIQADAPDEYKSYLHRSGRTGRAGKSGIVVTLVPRSRRRRTEELLQRAEITAEWTSVVPGDAIIGELAGN